MKEKETLKLYNSLTNIDDQFIEETRTKADKTRMNGWYKWAVLAACLCLGICVFSVCRLFSNPEDGRREGEGTQTEVVEIGSLEELASSYGGDLLAEKLVASAAKTTSIRLSYTQGEDASDPAAWNTLSIKGDYNGNDFTLDCSFDGESDRKNQTEAYAVTQYGNVEVTIYQEESDWSDPYIYRAEFTVDGVAYNLSIHSDDPEEIDDYLNILLGEPEDSNTQTLTDVLGFDVCRVEMEEINPHQVMWHYYVEVNGEDICVAEQFGYDNHPESWSRDLDGDGVPELICNNQYGDGVQMVYVYRNNNGSIEEGHIRWSYYEEKFGWPNNEHGVAGMPVELYDPERDIFTVTRYDYDSDTTVTAEFDDGLIPFEFLPFTHSL